MKGRMEMDTNDAFEQLRAELAAVEPSPGFAAGVRERIGAQSRHMFRLQPMLAFAAVAVAAVAGGTYLSQRANTVAPTPVAPIAQVATAPLASAPNARDAAAAPAPSVAARRSLPGLPAVAKTAEPRAIAEAAPGPFLEVITNQPEMLRRVWASVEGGVARAGLPANEFAEITVAPVTVDAIVVPKVGPPAGGGTIPGARRVLVDESARGDQR